MIAIEEDIASNCPKTSLYMRPHAIQIIIGRNFVLSTLLPENSAKSY